MTTTLEFKIGDEITVIPTASRRTKNRAREHPRLVVSSTNASVRQVSDGQLYLFAACLGGHDSCTGWFGWLPVNELIPVTDSS